MNATEKHTPTPWMVAETIGGKTKVWDSTGKSLFTLPQTRYPHLGLLIVRVVNSHDALVAALKQSPHALGDYAMGREWVCACAWCRSARAALAQAEGDQS